MSDPSAPERPRDPAPDRLERFTLQLAFVLAQSIKVCEAFVDLVDQSRGVAGYHLNGDLAEWDEFGFVDQARDVLVELKTDVRAPAGLTEREQFIWRLGFNCGADGGTFWTAFASGEEPPVLRIFEEPAAEPTEAPALASGGIVSGEPRRLFDEAPDPIEAAARIIDPEAFADRDPAPNYRVAAHYRVRCETARAKAREILYPAGPYSTRGAPSLWSDVFKATRALRDAWNRPGTQVDSDEFFALIHAVSEAGDRLDGISRTGRNGRAYTHEVAWKDGRPIVETGEF